MTVVVEAKVPSVLAFCLIVLLGVLGQRPAQAQGRAYADRSQYRKSDRAKWASQSSQRQSGTGLSPAQAERFIGWNFARQQGSNFLKHFLRTRSNLATLPISSDSSGVPFATIHDQRSAANEFSLDPVDLPGFDFRKSLPADFLPTGVAAGDINGDGKVDWVVSNGGSNSVWVFLGQGDGTTSVPTIVPLAGQSPLAVALADLRGIGVLDLVVAEADSSTVEVLSGNGDGTFGAGKLYATPDPPSTLAVADFNGDGHPDIVVGMLDEGVIDRSVETDAIALLPGNGTSFGAPIIWSNQNAVPDVTGMAVADLNGDGHPDLVVLEGFGGAPGIYGLLSQADGTFKQSYVYPHVPGIVDYDAIAVGDLNEDGKADLAIADTYGDVSIALGNGDGTFASDSTWEVFGTGDTGFAAAFVDLNGDGHLDLVTSGGTVGTSSSNYDVNAGDLVCVLFGDGTGNLSTAKDYRGEAGMYSLVVADLNADGYPDIVTANQDSDSASVYLNDGVGGFGDPSGGYVGYATRAGELVAYSNSLFLDVNGDGKPDLVVLEQGDIGPGHYQISVSLNDGTGHFGVPIRSEASDEPIDIGDFAFADFRHTGRPDFLLVQSEFTGEPFVTFAANKGDGTFATPATTNPPNAQGIVTVGDFNGDGNLDFVVAGLTNQNSPSAQLTVFLGHGDGTFSASGTYTFDTTGAETGPALIYSGDFNRDGKLDVLVWDDGSLEGSNDYNVYEFLGRGDGTFAPPVPVIANLGPFTLADLNHDGLPDAVELVQPNPPSSAAPPQFNIYLAEPDGTFHLTNSYSPYIGQFGSFFYFGKGGVASFGGPLVADFNGDGNPDIAAFQSLEGTGESLVQFLLGNGDGSFTPSFSIFNFENRFSPQAAFDVNGDGRADLIELDGYSSSYNVLRSIPGPAFQMRMMTDPVIGSNGGVSISLALAVSTPTTIALSASDPTISIPATVTIPAGELTQTVDFQIGKTFNPSHVFSIQGQLNGETEVAYASQSTTGQGLLFITDVDPVESAVPGGVSSDFGFAAFSAGGYSTTLTISCQGLPAGASCQIGENPLPLDAGLEAVTTLIVNVGSGVAEGSYPFSVIATDGTLTVAASATLNVGGFQISVAPSAGTTVTGGTLNFGVPVLSVDGYSQAVNLACIDVPAGATCSLASSSVVAQSPAFGDPLTIQVSSLPVGAYSFNVTGISGPLAQSTVGHFSVGDFTGSISPVSFSASVGGQATSAITVNSVNGLAGQIYLTCPSVPQGIGCSFSPNFANLPANGSVTSTLTISVFSKPLSSSEASGGLFNIGSESVAIVFSLFFFLLLGWSQQAKFVRMRSVARCVLLFCLLISLNSCGGGSGGTAGSGGGNNGGSSGSGGNGGGGSGSSSITLSIPIAASFGPETKTIGTLSVTVP